MKKNELKVTPLGVFFIKFLITMKLSVLLICLSVFTAVASETYSQTTKLSVLAQNESIDQVLRKIEDQSQYRFFYSGTVDTHQKVTVNSQNEDIETVLAQVLEGTAINYRIAGRQVALFIENDGELQRSAQQSLTVKGQVKSAQGELLPGVTVVIKGTSNGTITDADGNYNLAEVPSESILVFSFVGMKVQEIPLNGRKTVDVVLEEETIGLEEVVAIGYGTVRRADVTGSISSIGADDFNLGISMAPEQLMQGKVAGVNIIQNSGQPGAASTVRIRGSSSVSAGNDPLYVVDGVPLQFSSANKYVNVSGESSTSPFSSEGTNPLNAINPSDIESIEILKDASATAIYGSRGANGVIIITTKSKSFGESVTYDTYVGISTVRKKLDVLTADEYRNYAESNSLSYPDLGASTDWQDVIFRAALSQNHNVSFGGGTTNTSYRASFGYNSQEGIIEASKIQKYTARLNANHSAIDGKLKIALNMTYGKILDDIVPISSNIGNEGGNILKDAIRWAPTLPVYNEDGSYYQIGELRVNPLSWATDITDERKTNMFLGNVNISYNIYKDLKVSVNLGHNDEAVNRYTSVPSDHPIGEAEGGRASISKMQNNSSLIEANLTYNKEFGDNSSITALVGSSFQRFVTENTFTSANQFVSTSVQWNLMQSGSLVSNTSYKSANRLASQYARVNLKLSDRYLITATIRRDGSSRFGGNNQYGIFPSGAFAWKLSDEPFFNSSKISNMKVRVGYGVTGNQEIPNDLFREQLSISGSNVYVLGGTAIPSVLPSNYPNPDLKWETTSQANVGVDFGFWDQRVTGSLDYYKKHTTDLLLEFSTASPSVVATQWANVGEVDNTGFELSLEGKIIRKADFQWNASVNFSTNNNEVVTLSNENFSRDQILLNATSGVVSNGSSTQIIKPGYELGSFYGRKYTGLDANGMETYVDEDGDGTADLMVIGSANPDFTYGFSNSFFWKKFDMSISFRGVVGNDVYNNTEAEFSYVNAAPGVNVLRSALDSGTSRDQISQFSSRWIQKAGFLRLDNMSVGYTFDTDRLTFMSKARVYVTGQNLFIITDYSGYDPEVRTNTNRGGTAPLGIDYLSYPRPRIFMIGASLSF
ncbi:TonB-dependent receptor [Mangrovibacterium lignilyticum]|uniref:TonB-dependent receptor n=1 Tax=Mangrovibacterium lignilyticum TaxID=2668052 RepID=UPI0013D71DC9|nr:TonB-dependent receptor [Mangrovibacterium lignilyticum]